MISHKVNVFISYSHDDDYRAELLIEELEKGSLSEIVEFWTDKKIHGGERWRERIEERLGSCHVILLMLSPKFLESQFCMKTELPVALERSTADGATVIGVLLEECNYEAEGIRGIPVFSEKEVELELKYAAYDRFERVYATIDEDWWTLIDVDHQTKESWLVLAHREGLPIVPSGSGKRLLSGMLLGGVFGWVVHRGLYGGVIRSVWSVTSFAGLVALFAAVLLGVSHTWKRKNMPRDVGTLALFFGVTFLGGTIRGWLLATVSGVVWYFAVGRLGPVGAFVSSMLAGLDMFGDPPGSTQHRLRIYLDLIRAGRSPKAGWLIDRLDPLTTGSRP